WSFLELAQRWVNSGIITESADLFLLTFDEIQSIIEDDNPKLKSELSTLIHTRKQQWLDSSQLTPVPKLIYGQPQAFTKYSIALNPEQNQFRGIGSSAGQIEGTIKVISNLQQPDEVDRQTIIVVPYTDAGWSPLLARAGGLISEVGGRLSHGAIVAREYQIPAVMDLDNATQLFHNGQRVRLNGQTGIVEIIDSTMNNEQ
ncbi:MAG: PEP-utilizing enzyme, partial [Cyanobacteria bacterium J06558_2]